MQEIVPSSTRKVLRRGAGDREPIAAATASCGRWIARARTATERGRLTRAPSLTVLDRVAEAARAAARSRRCRRAGVVADDLRPPGGSSGHSVSNGPRTRSTAGLPFTDRSEADHDAGDLATGAVAGCIGGRGGHPVGAALVVDLGNGRPDPIASPVLRRDRRPAADDLPVSAASMSPLGVKDPRVETAPALLAMVDGARCASRQSHKRPRLELQPAVSSPGQRSRTSTIARSGDPPPVRPCRACRGAKISSPRLSRISRISERRSRSPWRDRSGVARGRQAEAIRRRRDRSSGSSGRVEAMTRRSDLVEVKKSLPSASNALLACLVDSG